ncbi:30S ribosomal protein S17e [Candidatus Pacearchaeota archaeon]|nr:30S ribosomal protein S17e [Candidatus Pacearchaeota archaeon]
MGRIKSSTVRKAAQQLYNEIDEFNDSFENNKKLLKGVIKYKSTRNKLAGCIVGLAKKEKLKIV